MLDARACSTCAPAAVPMLSLLSFVNLYDRNIIYHVSIKCMHSTRTKYAWHHIHFYMWMCVFECICSDKHTANDRHIRIYTHKKGYTHRAEETARERERKYHCWSDQLIKWGAWSLPPLVIIGSCYTVQTEGKSARAPSPSPLRSHCGSAHV